MKKEKKSISFSRSVSASSYFLASFATLETLIIIALVALLLFRADTGVIIVFALIAGVMALLVSAYLIRYLQKMRSLYYNALYKTSLENYQHLSDADVNLSRLPEGQYEEFDELNRNIARIENQRNHSVIYADHTDYMSFGIRFSDAENSVTDYLSFSRNLKAFILASGAFRNALVSIRYSMNGEKLAKKDRDAVIVEIKKHLVNYPDILIAPYETGDGFIVFIPRFDSVASLREGADYFVREAAVSRKYAEEGIRLFTPKVSVVIYPYSGIDDLFSDLRYAERQGGTITFYFPDRDRKSLNPKVSQNSVNVNGMSKIIEGISSESSLHLHDNYDALMKNFEKVRTFLEFDECGVILYDLLERKYKVVALSNDMKKEHIFHVGDEIKGEFVETLQKEADGDLSLYFSKRMTCTDGVGRFMDVFGISSGYLYLVKDTYGKAQGVIYFANHERETLLDTYLRESLLVFSAFVSTQIRNINNDYRVESLEERMAAVLKITNTAVYTIDKGTYELQSVSDSVKDMFPKVKTGVKCHYAFYGKHTPCAKCPLRTHKKMDEMIDFRNYETSLTLNSKEDLYATLLLQENDRGYATDRFDKDLLINTRYSLLDRMNGLFLTNGKGYVLALKLENLSVIIGALNAEGANEYLRKFASEIMKAESGAQNIYLYRNQVLAIVLPESGRNDIISLTEKIHDISKSALVKDFPSLKLEVNYIAIPYPSSFAYAGDYINHIDKVVSEYESDKRDWLYFEQTKYGRWAGHTEFLLSVIEDSFQNKTFTVRLQPMVAARTKRIEGAEMLLRLTDTYRNAQINTDEAIKVAAKNDKIGLISATLADYIGNYYQKFGFTVFKPKKFSRIAMNTDYSYFSDPAFNQNMKVLMDTFFLPKGFLSYELNEKDLYDHFSEYMVLFRSNELKEVVLVCDQYTGQFLSTDRLKQLGIKGLKISRNIVKDVDKDETALKSVMSIAENAEKNGLDVVLVGIENAIQYNTIVENNIDCRIQGYYFFQPLEPLDLINKIRDSNL